MVFEVRLFSLLFLFECTENLCNMNEHRKQKAQLIMDAEQEKKDNKANLGLQLQSPPHSLVRHQVYHDSPDGRPFASPTPIRMVEVQPAPVASHTPDLRRQASPPRHTEQQQRAIATTIGEAPTDTQHPSKPTPRAASPSEVGRSLMINVSNADGARPAPGPSVDDQPRLAAWILRRQSAAATAMSDTPFMPPTRTAIGTNNSPSTDTDGSAEPPTHTPQTNNLFSDAPTAALSYPSPSPSPSPPPPSSSPTVNRFGSSRRVGRYAPSPGPDGSAPDPVLADDLGVDERRGARGLPAPPVTTATATATAGSNDAASTHQNKTNETNTTEQQQQQQQPPQNHRNNLTKPTNHKSTAVTNKSKYDKDNKGSVPSLSDSNSSSDGVRRSYLLPNWFVGHRRCMKRRFLLKWFIGWTVLLYGVLIILYFSEGSSESHLVHHTDRVNNLQCDVRHVSGLQFIWCLVGCHITFLLFGLHRLYSRFPMDGFLVKKEFYIISTIVLPSIILAVCLPNTLWANVSSIPISSSTIIDDSAFIGIRDSTAYYFHNDIKFAYDTFFTLLFPTLMFLLVTELPLSHVESRDATIDLLSTEVVSNLDELLATKHGFASFFNFLKTEFTMQNLLYWRACKNFQAAIEDHRYLVRNIAESVTGDDVLGGGSGFGMHGGIHGHGGIGIGGFLIGGDSIVDGVLSGIGHGSSGERGIMSEVGSAGGYGGAHHHQHGLNTRNSPRNSVLSLSVNNVGLKVQRVPQAMYAHPALLAHSHLLQPSSLPNSGSMKYRGIAGGVFSSPGGGGGAGTVIATGVGFLENAHTLPHPPKNANLPPGAISPSVDSINSRGQPNGAAQQPNPYLLYGGTGATSLIRPRGSAVQEASTLSLGPILLQQVNSTNGGGGSGGMSPHGMPPRSLFHAHVHDPHAAPTPEIALAEFANPALRVARLQRQAAALAVEHTRLHAMKLLEKARSIHDRFVRDGAPYEVNDIAGPLREHILEFMSLLAFGFKSPVDQLSDIGKIFVDSQEFVYDLLSTDAFPRYLRSPFFVRFKSNARARAALQQVRIQRVTHERQREAAAAAAAAAASAPPPNKVSHHVGGDSALVSGGRHATGLGFSRLPGGGGGIRQSSLPAPSSAIHTARPQPSPRGILSAVGVDDLDHDLQGMASRTGGGRRESPIMSDTNPQGLAELEDMASTHDPHRGGARHWEHHQRQRTMPIRLIGSSDIPISRVGSMSSGELEFVASQSLHGLHSDSPMSPFHDSPLMRDSLDPNQPLGGSVRPSMVITPLPPSAIEREAATVRTTRMDADQQQQQLHRPIPIHMQSVPTILSSSFHSDSPAPLLSGVLSGPPRASGFSPLSSAVTATPTSPDAEPDASTSTRGHQHQQRESHMQQLQRELSSVDARHQSTSLSVSRTGSVDKLPVGVRTSTATTVLTDGGLLTDTTVTMNTSMMSGTRVDASEADAEAGGGGGSSASRTRITRKETTTTNDSNKRKEQILTTHNLSPRVATTLDSHIDT